MSEKKFLSFLVLILIGIPLFIGCFDSEGGSVTDRISSDTDDLGKVTVKMNFSQNGKISLKAPSGVTNVKIFLGSFSTNFIASEGEGIITEVPAGTHDLYAEGWSSGSKTHASSTQSVSVEKGKTTLVNVVMEPWTPPPASGLGTSWSYWGAAPFTPARYGSTSAVFNSKIWFMGGTDGTGAYNCVWSFDGSSWTEYVPPWSGRYWHSSVVHNGKLWVIGGNNGASPVNDVWYTADGSSWQSGTPVPVSHDVASAASDGTNLWLIGLNGNTDVWYTTDGSSWSTHVDSDLPGMRWGQSSTSFGGKIWAIGGSGASNNLYNQTPGTIWDPAPAPFTNKFRHTTVVGDSRMWVIGGYDDTDYSNDVWYTTDGSSWTAARNHGDANGFPGRYNHTSAYFGGKLWVIGGKDSGTVYNDVWYSTP